MRGSGKNKVITAVALFGVVGGMVGLSFASVPLYRLFCQVTGFGGTPNLEASTAPREITDDVITVRFDANVNSKLPWRFKPVRERFGSVWAKKRSRITRRSIYQTNQ